MSVNVVPPISLKEIQYNFGKALDTDVDSAMRYVRDFNQLEVGEEFSLLDYNGQAFGTQYAFMSRAEGQTYWQTHGDVYEMPLDESDRRITDQCDPDKSDAVWKDTDEIGRHIEIDMYQRPQDYRPAAIGVNGWWYASDVGEDNTYEANWTVATTSDWEEGSQIWGTLFGYRYGYLDGDREEYSMQIIDDAKANRIYKWNDTFTVSPDFRHMLQNWTVFMPGYNRDARSRGIFYDCTIKRLA